MFFSLVSFYIDVKKAKMLHPLERFNQKQWHCHIFLHLSGTFHRHFVPYAKKNKKFMLIFLRKRIEGTYIGKK